MAKKNKDTTQIAYFKTAEMAALFGLDTQTLGRVIFHQQHIVTVDFGTVIADRVSDTIFDIQSEAAMTIEAPVLIEALKGKWEADDETSN